MLLYLGARHPGLGSALVHAFSAEMIRRRASVVGALSHVHKPSGRYAADQVRTRSDYLRLRSEL